eukprot:5704212-Lingulodinium_polyedra.AAC.1
MSRPCRRGWRAASTSSTLRRTAEPRKEQATGATSSGKPARCERSMARRARSSSSQPPSWCRWRRTRSAGVKSPPSRPGARPGAWPAAEPRGS